MADASRAAAIRRRLAAGIADGAWPPGARLPSRQTLARELRASVRTVQAALAALAADGLVAASPGAGTRVVADPANRRRLGVVFAPLLTGGVRWSRFYAALHRVAVADDAMCTALDHAAPETVRLSGVGARPGLEPWVEVRAAARDHRLAGLLHTGLPRLDPRDAADLAAVPAVAIAAPEACDLPCLVLDHVALADIGLGWLRARGCRRVAALVPPDPGDRLAGRLRRLARRARLSCADGQVLEVGLENRAAIAAALHAVLAHRDGPPDGLLLADDHLVPVAAAVLARWDGPAPVVCAHGNAPLPAGPRDWGRIGFAATEVLATAHRLLRAVRLGARVPRATRIAPRLLG